ncbi:MULTISPECIES: aminotransferase class I/II-fold pyridoxal phosphate-dependent enzyme [Salinicola]|uniref:aminotransferase class I/II-fold pyridoxal phosphate-dependent enzyme n=1 Tax=Salinicola TaxID=404432 RepID=UPI0008DCDF9E|nr:MULTISPECIES: aminotransferase class I/II-fold pyridoxal phosphate-dependent enzyme [Salinicola]MDF3917769.1 aminotransferase class I/II-fold pyridoxal phosphate-dependent enzyme [Salinicola salarius]OHZ01582.1 8-amino-7-oxononanoate synthase [Salinicola sp. MIT1003]
MSQSRDVLKQRLLQEARQRRQQRPEGDTAPRPAATSVDERFTRFDRHPGYQQLKMMREGGKRLGIPDPFFKVHESTAGATTVIGGRECINFASYNYLGLAHHPKVIQAGIDALNRYGSSVSASRPVSGERPIHHELERAIAETYEVEDAVAFVSGHATNVSTLGYLLGPKDLILHDEYIHNSTVVGAQLSGARRMSFAHNDPAALETLLTRHRRQFERVVVVIEGLYSMDGDAPDLKRFVEIKQRHQAWLMVDEAHSFAVMGDRGLGLREYCGVPAGDVDIWMGTLSKTLSGCGGYIAGCRELVEMLRYFAPGFLYSVGMPAQVAGPSLAALQVMKEEPERLKRLHDISRYFLQQARLKGFDIGESIGVAVVPVIVGSSVLAAGLSDALLKDDINVQPILHPAVPEKSARLRFFLNCDHTREQIDRTLDMLEIEWKARTA